MDNKPVPLKRRSLALSGVLAVVALLGLMFTVAMSKANMEAQKAELYHVQLAVAVLMADNDLSAIPNPVTAATNDMGAFPDATTLPLAKGLTDGDKGGYLLYKHDKMSDGQTSPTVNYVSFVRSRWSYTVNSDGVVTQVAR